MADVQKLGCAFTPCSKVRQSWCWDPSPIQSWQVPSAFLHHCYRLFICPLDVESNHIFLSCNLFQECVCEPWAVAEQNCLNWVRQHQRELRVDVYKGLVNAVCSGKAPRYDKPSLKVGWTVRVCQPLAQGGDKSRQTTQSHWRVLQAFVLYSRTRRGDRREE